MAKRQTKAPHNGQEPGAARLSITIPPDDYTDLKRTAHLKRVSIAWVVRDAVHQYLRPATRQPGS